MQQRGEGMGVVVCDGSVAMLRFPPALHVWTWTLLDAAVKFLQQLLLLGLPPRYEPRIGLPRQHNKAYWSCGARLGSTLTAHPQGPWRMFS